MPGDLESRSCSGVFLRDALTPGREPGLSTVDGPPVDSGAMLSCCHVLPQRIKSSPLGSCSPPSRTPVLNSQEEGCLCHDDLGTCGCAALSFRRTRLTPQPSRPLYKGSSETGRLLRALLISGSALRGPGASEGHSLSSEQCRVWE